MPERFGKRLEDSPFALLWVAMRFGIVGLICFACGFCANATDLDGVQKALSAFAGGMVGTIMLFSGGGKYYFDLLKNAAEERIIELRNDLEAEKADRQNDNAIFAAQLKTLSERNDALQTALAHQ